MTKNHAGQYSIPAKNVTSTSEPQTSILKQRILFFSSYVLNTSVEMPHTQRVCTVKFRPVIKGETGMAVTTCGDGKFKLWALVDDTDIYRKWLEILSVVFDRWGCHC